MIRVVCAAIRHKNGDIILGPRHFDATMHKQIAQYKLIHTDWDKSSEQGFIDNHGVFLTRQEAFLIAQKEGQIIRRCGGDEGKLFSENLY